MKNSIRKKILLAVLIFSMMIITTFIASAAETKSLKATLLSQSPDPAHLGDIVEVRIGIQNLGSEEISDVIVELDPTYPFTIVPGEDNMQSVGAMEGYQGSNPDEIKTITYRLNVDRNAPAGTYDLNVITYEIGSNIKTQSTLSLEVRGAENAEVIHIDKTILVPGKQSGLKFSINNVGNAPLRDMTFSWENEDSIILPVGSDNTRYVSFIDVGESAELEYQVIADSNAEAGLYKLDLSLQYEDSSNGSNTKINTIAGVYVGGETDFDISFSESSSGQTSFTVANIGSNPATSVSVVVPQQSSWRVTGSNSVIVGNLNKGDYTVASFKLQSTRQANSTSSTGSQNPPRNMQNVTGQRQPPASNQENVLVQIAYTDTTGERRTINKEVALSSQNIATTLTGQQGTTMMRGAAANEGFFSKYKWPIIIIAALALGYYIYRKYKNPKNAIKENLPKRKNN